MENSERQSIVTGKTIDDSMCHTVRNPITFSTEKITSNPTSGSVLEKPRVCSERLPPTSPEIFTMAADQKHSDFVGTLSLKLFKMLVGLLGTLVKDSCKSCLGTLSRIVFLCPGTLIENTIGKVVGTFFENPVCSNAVFPVRKGVALLGEPV